MSETLSPKQVATAIGVSEASLKRWCDKGIIAATRTAGGHRRVRLSEVFRFLRINGHPVIRPEVLGLPAITGTGDVTLERSVDLAMAALEAGDDEALRRVVFNLYLADSPAVEIADRVLSRAFTLIGERWSHGSLEIYQERRGCEICMRTLYELRSLMPAPEPEAPLAIGGTLSGDIYTIATTMVEVTLVERGWRADSLGSGHPAATLMSAIRDKQPRLFWLSISHIPDAGRFIDEYNLLANAAQEHNVALAVGGRAIDGALRRQMQYSAWCDSMQDVANFAQSLYSRPINRPSPTSACG